MLSQPVDGSAAAGDEPDMVIVVNWLSELRTRLAARRLRGVRGRPAVHVALQCVSGAPTAVAPTTTASVMPGAAARPESIAPCAAAYQPHTASVRSAAASMAMIHRTGAMTVRLSR